MTDVELGTGAWFGDGSVVLDFPSEWDVAVLRGREAPPLEGGAIRSSITEPAHGPPLRSIAAGRRRVAVLVDDLTRPTPAAQLLPHVLAELHAAGLRPSDIVIVIAGGTHAPATPAEIARKIGSVDAAIGVEPHDSRAHLADLGRTSLGTPLLVNAAAAECDLVVGIGCIYPHPAAGFSGGAKIAVPGVCGAETIRRLHDELRTARSRGDTGATEFRADIAEGAERIGLEFVVNVVLDERRRITGCFAGAPAAAQDAGVAFALRTHGLDYAPDADVVVANAYPFDTSLQFLADRGLWPLLDARGSHRSRVAVAACPMGVGEHALFPVTAPVRARLARRIRNVGPRELLRLPERVANLRRQRARRRLELLMFSPGLPAGALARAFPRGKVYAEWPELRRELERRHGARGVSVAVYPAAPLQVRIDRAR